MSCQLDKVNICKISKYIVNVSGMRSDSVSPSDIWFLSFNDTYYKGHKINKAFLKLFVDVDLDSLSSKYPYLNNIYSSVYGLNYELIVYKDIIRPLVDYNICPNFIKYLSGGKGCSYDDILQFLQGKVLSNGKKKLSNKQVKNILNKNITYCLLKDFLERNYYQLACS